MGEGMQELIFEEMKEGMEKAIQAVEKSGPAGPLSLYWTASR
jgi:hypothetical protein